MINRTRVKICGITRLEDARLAVDMGADSIGLVFHQPSPRSVSIDQAMEIRQAIPPFVTVTTLFLDESEDWIAQVVHQLRPDCLQFHGNESPDFCESWQTPYIKAIPMGSIADPLHFANSYVAAQGFLMDSNAAGRQGGSGDTFDWSKIPASFQYPLILAGGLNASNVADAIAEIRPWCVDASTGVEVSKGIKSAELMNQFFQEIKRADDIYLQSCQDRTAS